MTETTEAAPLTGGDPMRIGSASPPAAETFQQMLLAGDGFDVLELGTLRWEQEPTHHEAWAPNARSYVKVDVEAGRDVDVVADAHDLVAAFGPASFDAVLAVSVWEHLERPWVAAEQVAGVLRPGGIVYVATHQTFPLHGYPNDFFRFSVEALGVLFGAPHFDVVSAGYSYPARIDPGPEVHRWNVDAEAWLNADLCGRRRRLGGA